MDRRSLRTAFLLLAFVTLVAASGKPAPGPRLPTGQAGQPDGLASQPAYLSPAYNVEASSQATPPALVVSSPAVSASTAAWRSVSNTAFQAGEDLYFVVRWGLVTGGHSTLQVHGVDIVAGRPTYHLVSDAHSSGLVDTFYKVHDRNDAWLDTASLTTLRYEKHIREGSYRIEETVLFDQEQHRYKDHSYRLDKNFYEDKEGGISLNILDVLGSLYYVRTLPMEVGQSYTFDVFSGGKIWPLVVKIKKREKVSVPAGKFDCFRVEPLLREPGIFVSKGKKLEVWLTADERRMPVLMRSEIIVGHVSAELVSYHEAVGASSVPSNSE